VKKSRWSAVMAIAVRQRTARMRDASIGVGMSLAAALAPNNAVAQDKPVPAAAASEILDGTKCREARAVVLATLTEFKGKMSAPLAKSLVKFSETCDLNTDFERVPGTPDDQAFGKFRLKIIAIKMAQASAPTALSR
jgi:hypothetical protein